MRKIHKLCADFTFIDLLYDPDIHMLCCGEIYGLLVIIMVLGLEFGFIARPEFTDTECIIGVIAWLILSVVCIGRICERHFKAEG